MRTKFMIEIKADILTDDQEARDAFEYLLKDTAEMLYAQVAMLSRKPPIVNVTVEDEEVGTISLPLFTSGVSKYHTYDSDEGSEG
jgi:hypothetical protein